MDFKWKLSRPGIELEFETGSISEAIGMLEEEGTKISEVFGFTMGAARGGAEAEKAPETATPPKERKQRAAKEAVAPPPLAVPSTAAALTPPTPPTPPSATLPPNTLMAIPEDGGIPPGLKRDANNQAPALSSPPLAPLPPPPSTPTPPPVGVLGPKVVAALDALAKGKEDGGAALSDWLHASGLTQKGAAYDDACRAVLMMNDEKLKAVAEALKVAA